ncbi:MAG TPA: hypothetical protein VMU50_04770, partial [Polyangia bacterium]|nr:hypothetical protein [Polyangia bacterium]
MPAIAHLARARLRVAPAGIGRLVKVAPQPLQSPFARSAVATAVRALILRRTLPLQATLRWFFILATTILGRLVAARPIGAAARPRGARRGRF